MLPTEIKVLDRNLANMIAAGEVVERPASVVKELVENAFDAGASEIIVEIRKGGKTYIRVSDNGVGMTMRNARKAFLRHATSKISKIEDLFKISSMGFRGEALAAISSVSKVELLTASIDDTYGTHIVMEGGDEISCEEMGLPKGTTIIVRDLFYNTPARFNFLKKDSTETANVVSVVHKLAISRASVSFKLIVDGKTVLSTDKESSRIDVIYSVFGKEISDNLLEVYRCNARLVVEGYIGRPRCSRSNRNYQLFFVNGRYVKSKTITAAVDKAYRNSLMNNKHAVAVLFLDIDPAKTDVNVHPTKLEIKFSDESFIFDMVYRAVTEGLEKEIQFNQEVTDYAKSTGGIPKVVANFLDSFSEKDKKEFGIKDTRQYLTIEDLSNTDTLIYPSEIEMPEEMLKVNTPPPIYANKELDYSPRLNAKLNEAHRYSRQTRLDIDELSLEFSPDRYDDSYIITNEIPYKYVGEIFKTYIIIESGTFYYMVDKHAAHERILFNKIYEQFKTSQKFSQTLIHPIPVSLSPEEADVAHRYKDEIERYGYSFTEFGDNDVLIRSVPYVISAGDSISSYIELLEIFAQTGEAGITEYENSAMKMLACKAAIKAGFESSRQELETFIKDLVQSGNINYCPHGRPIIVEYKRSEIERAFKRKI